MKENLVRFYQDETGATAVECSLIAAGITVALTTILWGDRHSSESWSGLRSLVDFLKDTLGCSSLPFP